MRLTTRERLLLNSAVTEAGCWEWTRTIDPGGYGRVAAGSPARLAHRVSYETFVAPIPDGLQIDHLCRNRKCVNPEHLEVVTQTENVRRGLAVGSRGLTHCPAGHPYNEINTYVRPSDGAKQCIICRRESQRRYREKQAA